MSKHKISDYAILYAAFFVYSLSSVCAKFAALQSERLYTFLFFAAEIVCLGVYALIYQQALKRFSLVVAMSNKGITVILGLLWSIALFGEQIGLLNILGAVVIIAGIWMVSSDG